MVYKTVNLIDGREVVLDWLRKRDIPEIVELLNNVIGEGKYLLMNEPITDMKKELEWYDLRTREGMLYLTARLRGKLIGCAEIHSHTDKHAHIASYGIFISKNFRNLGLGTLLTKEFVEIAKQHKVEILHLSVHANNERAFHVYEQCGFREAGRLTKGIKFVDGTYTDEILMEMLLK